MDKNVTFEDLLDNFAAKRKVIIVVGFIFAILCGGFGVFNGYRHMQSYPKESMINPQQDDLHSINKAILEIIEITKPKIVQRILDISQYARESLYFNLLSSQLAVTKLDFVVETVHEGIPYEKIENPDQTQLFLSVYSSAYINEEFFQKARALLKRDLMDFNILELIQVPLINEGKMLRIITYAPTLEESSDLASLVLNQMQKTVTERLGKHIIIITSKYSYWDSDGFLEKKHSEYMQMFQQLDARYSTLDTLKKNKTFTVTTSPVITWSDIIISGVKYAIVGFVLGVILIMIFMSMFYIERYTEQARESD